MRRSALAGMLASITGAGGLPPRRIDQYTAPAGATAPATQPTAVAFFIAGNTIILNPSGMFIYNGPPGLNKLIASITPAPGTDPYGNGYAAGITSYGIPSSGIQVQLLNEQINFVNGITLASITTTGGANNRMLFQSASGYQFDQVITEPDAFLLYNGSIALGNLIAALASTASSGTDFAGNVYPKPGINFGTWDATGVLRQHFGIDTNGKTYYQDAAGNLWTAAAVTIGGAEYWQLSDSSANTSIYANASGQLIPDHPGSPGTPETWQQPVTTNFSTVAGVQPFQYRMGVEGMVEFTGFMSANAAYAANTAIFTLPAGYRPSTNTAVVGVQFFAGGAFSSTWATITTAGVFSFANGLAAGGTANVNGRMRLSV